jgi:hypothetical protein
VADVEGGGGRLKKILIRPALPNFSRQDFLVKSAKMHLKMLWEITTLPLSARYWERVKNPTEPESPAERGRVPRAHTTRKKSPPGQLFFRKAADPLDSSPQGRGNLKVL